MKIFNNILLRSLIIVTLIIAIWSAVIINKATTEKEYIIDKIMSESQINDHNTGQLIEKYISEIIENLKVVRDANEVKTFLNAATDQHYDDITQLFVRIIKNKRDYDQIRYIDTSGQEIIRVDQNKTITVVAKEKLQNKANRYYFSDAISLNDNDVYISPLDLNVENGQVELPYKPMLRFSVPIFDHNKTLHGILVINYKATKFINLIKNHREHHGSLASKFYILNKEGQFICHPEKDKNFSFMFENTANLSFKNMNRALWDEMAANHFIGNKVETNHIYAYYDVLSASKKNYHSYQQQWILVHSIDTSNLLSWRTLLGKLLLTSNLIIFTVIIFLSFLLAYIVERLMFTDSQLEIIFEHNAAGIFLVDENRDIFMVNQRFCDIVGFTKKELIGQNACFAHISQESYEAFGKFFKEAKDGLEVKLEYFVKKKGCDGIWVEFFGSKIELDEKRNGVIWSIIDISERKSAEETIQRLAFYDPLTGLANRRLLEDRLSLMIANKKRNSNYGAVLFLDLDNFKVLNDTHGHQAGDVFLKKVASRLLSCVREIDTVSRFGGDEFVIIIDGLAEDKENAKKEILNRTRKILSKLNEPYKINLPDNEKPSDTIQHLSSASIGISLFNLNDKKNIVLDQADKAMYLVKDSGKNNIVIL